MYFVGSRETQHYQGAERLSHTPGSAVANGKVVNIGGSLFGYADSAIEASRQGALALAAAGIRWCKKATATTFTVGDEVWLDASTGLAVAPNATPADADLPLGICVATGANGPNAVAYLPFGIMDRYSVIRPFVYEFDCSIDNGDTDEHVLIPAWMNRHGLILRNLFGLVTEAMVGSSEDQGIVTVEDEDDNAIATLTAADAAADAVGDILVASLSLCTDDSGDISGTAWKTVAAGKAVQGFVSQQTSGGTEAGKIKVFCDFVPLV